MDISSVGASHAYSQVSSVSSASSGDGSSSGGSSSVASSGEQGVSGGSLTPNASGQNALDAQLSAAPSDGKAHDQRKSLSFMMQVEQQMKEANSKPLAVKETNDQWMASAGPATT